MLEDFPGVLCQYLLKFMKTPSHLRQTFAALENAPAGGFRRFRAEMTSAWLPVDSKLKPQVLTQGGWGGPQRQALCPLNWSFSLQDKPWPSMPCSFGNWQTASQIQPRSVID